MFTIGQFSRITGLSIKTIRLYHEKGLLTPKWVGEASGYRTEIQILIEDPRENSHEKTES